jgi:uncharacterized protein YsxB (DUF464 family)
MDSLYYLKLMNGEDIVCKIISQDDQNGCYLIASPLKVTNTIDQEEGRLMMGLSRWIPLQKSPTLNIYMDHVIAVAEVHESMYEFYTEVIEQSDTEVGFDDTFLDDDITDDKVKMALYFANTSSTIN